MSKKVRCCGAVVMGKAMRVLMVHQENGMVGFPKGHMEEGETEIETAKREVLEETGIKIRVQEDPYFEFDYHIDDEDVDKTVVLFIAGVEGKEKIRRRAGEIKKAEWVEFHEVDKKLQYQVWKEAWLAAAQQMVKQSLTGTIYDIAAMGALDQIKNRVEASRNSETSK